MTGWVSRRFWRVWQRNFRVYQRNWLVNFIPPLLEPLLYLMAFGVGLNRLIGDIDYRGMRLSYAAFIAPGLLAINMMNNAFFENTYGSFVRMYYQKTFDAMMATPLNLPEIITGEIIWGATKSVIATSIMIGVISLFGFVQYPAGLLVIPLSFLGGMAFGSLGMFFTGTVRNIEIFNLPIFLFITPMFLFSGTFFPLETLPPWAQTLSAALPLTHLAHLCRCFCLGIYDERVISGLVFILIFILVFFPLAVARMRRRLIK